MNLNEILIRVALAAEDNGGTAGKTIPPDFPTEPSIPERYRSIGGILGAILNVVFYVGIALSVIFLILGGIQYMMAGGDETKIAGARSQITNAILGFVVVIAAFTVRWIIKNLLGVTGIPTDLLPGF